MANVVLEQIYKSYDKTDIIQDLSLSVSDREFLVLVGPSGCGKSTILRMIAGLESITQGTLKIGDRVMNEVPPKDRDIAMVFQSYALYPHMNVFDNMAFGLKMRKFPKADIQQRVSDAAKILDLEALLTRKPKQLSGGQRQRVALGRAIVRDPKVFLMDEPLSNLDAKLRVQMRAEISQLHRRLNATTLYVTHDQVEAMTMGDRIVILNQGRVQQVDTPLVVYNQPANRFVASFIGQMNFLTGQLEGPQLVFSETFSFLLPPSLAEAAKAFKGKSLQLGIRPEHFVPPNSLPEAPTLTITPSLIETLGSEQMIHFSLANTPVIAKLPSDLDASVGTPLALQVDLQRSHLFDPDSEQRIIP